jgi:hypothetical protein
MSPAEALPSAGRRRAADSRDAEVAMDFGKLGHDASNGTKSRKSHS